MARRSDQKQAQIDFEREMEVFKRNDLIQKARFTLTVVEQRSVLYAISKIQPEDTYLKEYTFEIKDFYDVIGWKNESYTAFKAMLKKLRDRSWWILMPDGKTESAVSWFSTVRSNESKGKVTVKFHEDMMPYLVELAKQNTFYTSFNLKYVLPMSSQFGPRLYELLKSYSNNEEWFFEVDELKKRLDCENYKNYADFKRFALDPAVKDINKYSDLRVNYDAFKDGVKYSRIVFYIESKTNLEIAKVERVISDTLDGGVTEEDLLKQREMFANSGKAKFLKEHRQAIKEERQAQDRLSWLGRKE